MKPSAWFASVVARQRGSKVASGLMVAALFTILTILAWPRARIVIFDPDSFGYVYPGLLMAAGGKWPGSAIRDLGYPVLVAVAVRLAGLLVIPKLQLVAVLGAIAAILATLHMFFEALLQRPSGGTLRSGIAFGLAATAYCALLFSDDQFALFIHALRPEAVLCLPLAAAFLLFQHGWAAQPCTRQIVSFAAAMLAAYAAVLLKPSALAVFGLCLLSLIIAMIRARRELFRSVLGISSCFACVAVILVLHQVNAKLLTARMDFGPRTFFCNHLPLIIPVLGEASPARAQLSALLSDIVHNGPRGWTALGFDGDDCFDGAAVYNAIEAAREADGLNTRAWLERQSILAVIARPLNYIGTVLFQLQTFAARPFPDIDLQQTHDPVDDDVWRQLAPFASLARLSRADLAQKARIRSVYDQPGLGWFIKAVLAIGNRIFEPVVALTTAFALVTMMVSRQNAEILSAKLLLGAAAFTLAFALTTAMSHSFDISRYAVSIMPFSLFWLLISLIYIPSIILRGLQLLAEAPGTPAL